MLVDILQYCLMMVTNQPLDFWFLALMVSWSGLMVLKSSFLKNNQKPILKIPETIHFPQILQNDGECIDSLWFI